VHASLLVYARDLLNAELPPGLVRVAIPTLGVESLNAAVAVGIACFETARRSRR